MSTARWLGGLCVSSCRTDIECLGHLTSLLSKILCEELLIEEGAHDRIGNLLADLLEPFLDIQRVNRAIECMGYAQ